MNRTLISTHSCAFLLLFFILTNYEIIKYRGESYEG
nr:MAG TPA: hypothetical protein [Caudoviricetes sp.]